MLFFVFKSKSFTTILLSFFLIEVLTVKKRTAWGNCVSWFAFRAFPVIVRDADSLIPTRKVARFTATLFSCTIRAEACNDSKVMLLNSANSSFSSLFQLRHGAKGIFLLGGPKGSTSNCTLQHRYLCPKESSCKPPLLYGKLRERAVCSEFCVLIGYPSGQDGAILPSLDCPFRSRK